MRAPGRQGSVLSLFRGNVPIPKQQAGLAVAGDSAGAFRRGGLLPAPDFAGLQPPGDVVLLRDQTGRFYKFFRQGDLIAVAQ